MCHSHKSWYPNLFIEKKSAEDTSHEIEIVSIQRVKHFLSEEGCLVTRRGRSCVQNWYVDLGCCEVPGGALPHRPSQFYSFVLRLLTGVVRSTLRLRPIRVSRALSALPHLYTARSWDAEERIFVGVVGAPTKSKKIHPLPTAIATPYFNASSLRSRSLDHLPRAHNPPCTFEIERLFSIFRYRIT